MTFDEWINQRYVEWRGDKIGDEGSLKRFADWIGVQPQSISDWRNGKRLPESFDSVMKLVDKYGGEVLAVLGIQVNPEMEVYVQMREIARQVDEARHRQMMREAGELMERWANNTGAPKIK